MKKTVFLLLLFVGLFAHAQKKKNPPAKYWEDMTEQEKKTALNDSTLSPIIVDYYKNNFNFNDDKQTTKLFKALTNDNEYNQSIRLFLFNKIVLSGDTSINKYLTEYSVKMIYNQTRFVIKFLNRERVKKNMLYKKYIPFLVADLNERIEYDNFKSYLNIYFNTADEGTKQFLQILFKELSAEGAGKIDAK